MDMEAMVKEFHAKHGYPIGTIPVEPVELGDFSDEVDNIRDAAEEAMTFFKTTPEDQDVTRNAFYRIHGMTEEHTEVIDAMEVGNKEELADALADMLYWVIGTAVTYGIPINRAFYAVHKSNMTKQVRTDENVRLRDKGPDYYAPEITDAIDRLCCLKCYMKDAPAGQPLCVECAACSALKT